MKLLSRWRGGGLRKAYISMKALVFRQQIKLSRQFNEENGANDVGRKDFTSVLAWKITDEKINAWRAITFKAGRILSLQLKALLSFF